MKRKIIYIAAGILLTFSLTSCFEDLEVAPTDFFYPESYFQDSAQCNNVLTGCYDALQGGEMFNGGNNGFQTIWNVSDEMYYGAYGTGPKIYSYTSGYPANYSMWKACYLGVQRANQLIANIGHAKMKEATLKRMTGEAKALRAFFYLTLVQNWGEVPLLTEPTSSVNDTYVYQSKEADIYDFIIKELTEAESMVSDITVFNNASRITKSAVRGLAARACLFKAGYPCNDTSKYQEAYNWAKKVIDSGLHGLNENYAQVFINTVQDLYDIRESIWEVELYNAGKSDTQYKEYGPSLSVTLGTNQGNSTDAYAVSCVYKVHKKLFDLYEPEDANGAKLGSKDNRRNWAIGPYTYSVSAINNKVILNVNTLQMKYYADATADANKYNRQPNKFNRQYSQIPTSNSYQSNTGTNTIMLRYSDILLMAAEASNEINGPNAEAIGWVNEVRARAYGNLSSGSRIDNITVTNGGTGYTAGQVYVQVGDATNYATTITANTVIQPIVYTKGYVKGAPTVAPAVVTNGKISAIELWDRGDSFTKTPTVTILSADGKGSGATAVAVMGKTFDHKLPANATDTKESFRQSIKDERARELCFEGWRRLDLKRWNELVETLKNVASDGQNATGLTADQVRFISIAGTNVSDSYNYLPIPATELSLNKYLVQTKGW